jgi:hypothetical protein
MEFRQVTDPLYPIENATEQTQLMNFISSPHEAAEFRFRPMSTLLPCELRFASRIQGKGGKKVRFVVGLVVHGDMACRSRLLRGLKRFSELHVTQDSMERIYLLTRDPGGPSLFHYHLNYP